MFMVYPLLIGQSLAKIPGKGRGFRTKYVCSFGAADTNSAQQGSVVRRCPCEGALGAVLGD
jgi:hypothetical protein